MIIWLVLQSRVFEWGVVAAWRAASIVPSLVDIESLVLREMPFAAQMPFSRVESLIPLILQCLGDGNFVQSLIVPVFGCRELGLLWDKAGYPVGYVDSGRIATCHNCGSSGGANRRGGVSVRKANPGSGQGVDVGGFVEIAPVAPEPHPPQIIDKEKNEIGLSGSSISRLDR